MGEIVSGIFGKARIFHDIPREEGGNAKLPGCLFAETN
jgi:hypothetical protein